MNLDWELILDEYFDQEKLEKHIAELLRQAEEADEQTQ